MLSLSGKPPYRLSSRHIRKSLDALAADGVRFENAYSSTPTCTPARAALLTGQSGWNNGMIGYGAIGREVVAAWPPPLSRRGRLLASLRYAAMTHPYILCRRRGSSGGWTRGGAGATWARWQRMAQRGV